MRTSRKAMHTILRDGSVRGCHGFDVDSETNGACRGVWIASLKNPRTNTIANDNVELALAA